MLAAVVAITGCMSKWHDEIRDWVNWLTSGGTARGTVSLRRYQLFRLCQDHPRRDPYTLTPEELAGWMASHRWGLESLRSYQSALRSFYGWAYASGKIGSDPSRLLRRIKRSAAQPRPAPEGVIDRALASADPRGWLLLMLGSRQGLRRGEMSRVHSDDLLPDGDGWALIVHGKGGKDRIVPLLGAIADSLRALPVGWAFPNGLGGPITPGHVGVLIRRALVDATSHQLRHRFGTVAYQATGDIRAVQELLGHASVATTQRYTAVANGALRRVMQTAA